MKKDVLLRFMQEQQQKLQPVISNEGFKNGAPPAGTNYRIPSDTLYNPTPHHIKAVSNNGMEAELQPFDETQVHFPGAEYVDEYEMRYGGIRKFLSKAQEGLQVTARPNLPDLSKPLSKNAVRVNRNADSDSFFENVAEFADPTGITSWDDAKKAYAEWQRSGEPYPTVDQALSIFGAVPALGKFSKIKYLDPESIKQAYKYIPWQQIVNFFDTSEDIQNDNTSQRVQSMPVKKEGGLSKFLPKAQTGLQAGMQAGMQAGIPADADRYGVNAAYDANQQFANQADVDAYREVQGDINRGSGRAAYEQRILEEINRQQMLAQKDAYGEFNVKEHADFLPQWVLDNPDSYYCISGACYTVNQAGEPLRFYDNSTAQNQILAGNVPNWKVNHDTSIPQGGDIMQFLKDDSYTANRLNDGKVHLGGPHHAGVIVPGSMKKNPDGTISVQAYMNGGSGDMTLGNWYTYNPKTDLEVLTDDNGVPMRDDKGEFATHYGFIEENGRYVQKFGTLQSLIDLGIEPDYIRQAEGIQFLTRDFSKEDAGKVKKRNLKRQKIEEEDPQFFKKGQERRWATYAPGLITFTGDDHAYMYGEDLGRGNQYLGSLSEEANRLLTRNTDKFDYNLDELSKTAGFKDILGMVNDPQWKQDFMKKYNISNREFNGVVLNTLGIYGQETGFGTKKGEGVKGLKENDYVRSKAAMVQNIWNKLTGQGSNEVLGTEDYSRGLTQVKFRNISKEDREKYGLTAQNIESDPKKAFIAAMLVSAQNLPELRRLAQKGETASLDESNYLDFLPYMYQMPNRLRRGDKKTITRAIDEGVSPEQALVKDPNSPEANNNYLKNVRTYASLFNHNPLQETLEIRKYGGPFSPLGKFIKD